MCVFLGRIILKECSGQPTDCVICLYNDIFPSGFIGRMFFEIGLSKLGQVINWQRRY